VATIWSRVVSGLQGFKQGFLQPEAGAGSTAYAESRLNRYDLLWALYGNAAYTDLIRVLQRYQTDRRFYRYIRGIYNPARRIVEFYVQHVAGGVLDTRPGRGALPIETENEGLRAAIGQVWQWSNWQSKKSVMVRHGAALGDTFLKVVDDTARQKVFVQVLWPGIVTAAEHDDYGNVTSYTVEYTAKDAATGTTYTYKETCDKAGFATFRDGQPFAYGGAPATWANPYGFVPMVHAMHLDLGGDWGAVPHHATMDKVHELNDQASLLNDQVRKAVNVPWAFIGVDPGNITLTSGQDDVPILAIKGASKNEVELKALLYEIDIEHALANIQAQIEEIERDHPELTIRKLREQVRDVTGRAVRLIFDDAERLVVEARANYDDGQRRALQMAMSIAGFRGYGPEFEGMDLGTYAAGGLDFTFGERPVLPEDEAEKTQADLQRAQAAQAKMAAGVPRRQIWREMGYTDEDIARMEGEAAEQAASEDNIGARLLRAFETGGGL
jgi:hypothetical protein